MDLHYTTSTGLCDVKKFVMDAMGEITLGPHRGSWQEEGVETIGSEKDKWFVEIDGCRHNYR